MTSPSDLAQARSTAGGLVVGFLLGAFLWVPFVLAVVAHGWLRTLGVLALVLCAAEALVQWRKR